jgi:hypothetical protein
MGTTKRRSRREIELSFDLKYLNPKVKRKMPPPLSDEEIARLADKFSKHKTKQGEWIMLDINTVQQAVSSDDVGKWDVSLSLRDLQMDPQGNLFRRRGKGHLALTDHALRQLCQRVIPYKGGTLVSHLDLYLRHQVLNPYLKRRRESALVRGKGKTIRAILSDDFMLYDNKHLMAALPLILSGLESRGVSHNVKKYYLDDQSLWIDITFPSISRQDLGGLEGGIRVGNSEVGLRSITCWSLVWRQVCSNGLMSWGQGEQLFKKVHRGRLDTDEVSERLATAISTSLASSDDLMDKLAASASEAVPDIEAVIERIVKRRNLSGEFAQAMYAVMVSERDTYGSLFGLVNAMTRASHLYQGDRRVAIEQEASRLLNWREDDIYSEIIGGNRW